MVKLRNAYLFILLFGSVLFYGCNSIPTSGENKYNVDVCIYGTTSAGVIAAYAAKKAGKSVVLAGPEGIVGGMTTGGLGKTDVGKTHSISGLARKFYKDVGTEYDTTVAWLFEPKVALKVFNTYLKEMDIPVLLRNELIQVDKKGSEIQKIILRDLQKDSRTEIKAKEFLDCTYEGDLFAKADVSFTRGREDNSEYGETINGYQLADYRSAPSGFHQFPDGISPYNNPEDSTSGLIWGVSKNKPSTAGQGDDLIQAYNLRVCLTDNPENRIPITRPEDYDSTRYELLVRLFEAQPNLRNINDYFIWDKMPNHKTDVNNRGGISTDLINENQSWPEASYEERQKMLGKAISYTKGLLYFYKTDPRVPKELQKYVQDWGYPKDEYENFNHFTPQMYVREGRRLVGEYVMTEHDCRGDETVEDGIALASYTMDSHNCQRIIVNGMVKNEGNVEVPVPGPYPVSYRAITPKREECTNLLVPVCLSSSHIAYGSIRMEPVFMMLGQAAGLAAVSAIDEGKSVQEINIEKLKNWLKEDPELNGRNL